ncbi:hypothetical protein JG688_00016794 [Phytophthora aleatoria]|uniref:Uncharacterized protein n=1 Tax=Phytophthora aleatoria TaxID=2496075 RepID=A0A8J5IXT2_9STRA|nr:hypothetical protein JG688_00016794 [Phytophthora aleatoria]
MSSMRATEAPAGVSLKTKFGETPGRVSIRVREAVPKNLPSLRLRKMEMTLLSSYAMWS